MKLHSSLYFLEEDISAYYNWLSDQKRQKEKKNMTTGCVPLKFSISSRLPAQKFFLRLLLKSDVSSCLGYCDLHQFLSVQILIPFYCNENLSFTCNNTSKLKFVALQLSKMVTPQFVVLLYLKMIFDCVNPLRIVLNFFSVFQPTQLVE